MPRFKRLTTSADRQRCYGRWVLKSFLTLSGISVVCLLILQRAAMPCWRCPPEFIPLAARLGAHLPTTQLLDKSFLIGIACGAMISGILIGVLLARKLKTTHATLGDIEPLMPRNAAESGWATLLSLNAGFSEEANLPPAAAAAAGRGSASRAGRLHPGHHRSSA